MYSEVTSVYVPVKTPDYRFWAILLSVIVHVMLLGLIIFFHHSAPPPPMETTLVTPEQLSKLEGQIKANQQNNAATSGDSVAAPNPMANMRDMLSTAVKPPRHTQTNQIQTVNDDIAAKQAKWQKDQALFAEKLDREAQAEQQGVIEQLDEKQDAEQKNLHDYKAAENSIEEVKGELKATAAAYEKNKNPKKSDTAAPTVSKSLDLGTDGKNIGTGQSQTHSNGGNSTSRRGATSGGNSAGYLSQIKGIIESHWSAPANSQGKTLTASFNISPSGVISNIRVNGGDESFKNSLIKAIQSSSPLPVPPTDDYDDFRSNNFTFTAN